MKVFWFSLIFLTTFAGYGQNFLNSDLDGIITNSSDLPNNWNNVPFTDPSCQATSVVTCTPDLTSLTQPLPSAGVIGNPFSGTTFLSGLEGGTAAFYYHEGIMQTVNGLTTGQTYTISFYQSVVKQDNALDTSGGWTVYFDNTLIGTTVSTVSQEPFNSTNLSWEHRTFSFTATSATHTIKFLPSDDDSNHAIGGDTDGSLRMGIDKIELICNNNVVDLGSDTVLCEGETLNLDASAFGVSYLWQDSTTAANFLVNSPGSYWVEVEACGADTIIVDYQTISIGQLSIDNPGCPGATDGELSITNVISSTGGTIIVSLINPDGNLHQVDTINSGDDFPGTGLNQGQWEIQIETGLGCHFDTSVVLVADQFNTSVNIGHPQCFGTPTGSITAFSTTTGTFSFVIEDENGNMVNDPGTNTANSLSGGIYTITTIDDSGCEIAQTAQLVDPPAISIDLDLVHPLCYGDETGEAIVDTILNAQGDYSQIFYGWDPNPNGSNGQGIISNAGLPAGEYILEVVDDIGCSNEITFFIIDPNPLVGVVQVISPTYCRSAGYQSGNGEVTVTTAGIDSSGTGNVTYLWKNLETGKESPNTTFIVTEPGLMAVTITDDNGCVFKDTVQVDSINPIADFTPVSDQFEGPGEYEGTAPMEIEFINESTNAGQLISIFADTTFKWNLYTNQVPGGDGNWFFSHNYYEKIDTVYYGEEIYHVCLVAKNFNDCRDTICKSIIVHDGGDIALPNVFTPGQAPNQTFRFPAQGIKHFDCSVLNRYGTEVFRFYGINDAWDGTEFGNGKLCKDGVYFYTFNAETTNGTHFSGQGTIQLIRAK